MAYSIEMLRAWATSHAAGPMKSSQAVAVLELLRIADEANEVLRSAASVADRNGSEVNLEGFSARIKGVLQDQHEHKIGTCFRSEHP